MTLPLTPLPDASPEDETWPRVANLLRLGAYAIVLAGVVKATGALVKATSVVLLLLYWLRN
jgi:hypothetical protein